MPPVNPKNVPTSAVAGDLGIQALLNPEGVAAQQEGMKEKLLPPDPLKVVSAADELFK